MSFISGAVGFVREKFRFFGGMTKSDFGIRFLKDSDF